MRWPSKRVFWWTSLATVLLGAAVAGGCKGKANNGNNGGEAAGPEGAGEETGAVPVSVIRPKRDPSFVISVEEPAYVEAYYRADLEARVAGNVKFLQKDIGDPVTKGELLLEVDVPDLVQQVAQKEAVVEQRRQELALAQANLKSARADVDVAQNTITEKQQDVATAEATRIFRQKELRRFRTLAEGNSPAVTPDIVDEREMYYQSAVAAESAAQAAVAKARSDLEEAKAKLDAATADVNLKQALIEVARKDRDQSQALADYAKITAPFKGVIVARTVDPGSFVQNAATGHSDPLLTVERTDVLTVYMKVPDNYAPYVDRDTEAIIEMSSLPGQLIHAKVTRYSPSLQQSDRTMRVEVDLYNGLKADYQKLLADPKAADLKGGGLPVFPTVTGKEDGRLHQPLLPGMFGRMRLVLHKFKDAYLVPSNVVISQGGKPYIFLVKNGKVEQEPVDVQVDDGSLAKVAIIAKVGNEEVKQDLTGNEEVIASNQGEVTPGQQVKPVAKDW